MRSYGIPCKMVRVIADIYKDFKCVVKLTEVRDQTGSRSSLE